MSGYHDLWVPSHGAEMDPADFEMQGTPYHVSHRLHGQGIERMFPGGNLSARPFSTAPANIRRLLGPGGQAHLDRTVTSAIRGEVHPESIDPRWLKMTQSAVVLPGVRYYAEDSTYRKTGQTYADQGQAGNRFPVVFQHSGMGLRMILSGHHRAAAALATGTPLRALVLRDEDWK